jgi:NAD(P)-dependent dehydrogenase (short-subunit alcohol dehydrogenase family)
MTCAGSNDIARARLAGRLAVVTGGASGIGLGIVRAFARAGMRVVIAHRLGDRVQAALETLRSDASGVHAIEMDVTDRRSVAGAAEQVANVFGDVHVLCNSAGVNQIGPIDESTYEDWDWIMGVNVGGVVNSVLSFLPKMKEHGHGGHIVNVASMASFVPSLQAGIYGASKFAVRGLSESLRLNLAPHGIGVSLVCPGLTRTEIWQSPLRKPERFRREGRSVDLAALARLERAHEVGMDPLEVGEKTLRGMLRNDLYIFTHAEFGEELEAVHARVSAALPSEHVDPERDALERTRRAFVSEASRVSDSLSPFGVPSEAAAGMSGVADSASRT